MEQIKLQKHELIGKKIYVKSKVNCREMVGTITDIIPANTKPSDDTMAAFYGDDWRNKQCKGANRAIKWNRVSFIDEYTGHPIVLPLNPVMIYNTWEIE